jgi:hypothetical protein
MGVQAQCMIGNDKALGMGYGLLARLDFGVIKLFYTTAVQAHHVVVVLAFIELVHGFATFKVVAAQDAGLFKLGQHTVNGGQANVCVVVEQVTKHVFSRHVTHRTTLKHFQDFQARQSGFEAVVFKFVDLAHGRMGLFLGGHLLSNHPLQ